MPTITIQEAGCRDCNLCVDTCPTDVLERQPARRVAAVARPEDCIGCTSCAYVCPSRCLTVDGHVEQRPFHRIELNSALVSRFLQKKPVATSLSEADYEEALGDVRVRLRALGDAVTETMGRGQKAVGRAAGTLAAGHLPEMYEETTLDGLLRRLACRFTQLFEFSVSLPNGGHEIVLSVSKCAFRRVVEGHKDAVGTNVLCTLFHETMAGLVSSFTNKNYAVEMKETGAHCTMVLQLRS
ncbi:MAG: 4Fe-4S dicluster domain-containing protein [Polyangiaceae bacterium]|jgi:NAD-dependent dihydropyrimidine dehydrogenase PreA subunit